MSPENQALTSLEDVVGRVLAYFDGPGRSQDVRIDQWHARDVLMHFIYFHEATAWGIQSVAVDGPVWTVPADSDTINEICRILHEGETLDELLVQVRNAHARLRRSIANSPDLDRPCFERPGGGTPMTGNERVAVITAHWSEHLDELEGAARKMDSN